MSERRFWFVIDKGKLEYVQDNVTGEKITVTELEDLLNEQQAKIQKQEKIIKALEDDHKRQENEIKLLRQQYNKIPPKIREVWKE